MKTSGTHLVYKKGQKLNEMMAAFLRANDLENWDWPGTYIPEIKMVQYY